MIAACRSWVRATEQIAKQHRQYGWCMWRGDETLETKKFSFEVYLILEKGVSFFDYQWDEPGLGNSATANDDPSFVLLIGIPNPGRRIWARYQ